VCDKAMLYCVNLNSLYTVVSRWINSEWLHCDCHLRWMVAWLKFSKVQLEGVPVCRSPSSMDGQPLNQVTKEQLHCGKRHAFATMTPRFRICVSVRKIRPKAQNFITS